MDIADIWERILLSADYQDLPRLCSTNNLTNDICNDSLFWKRRFRQDGIPLSRERSTFREWYNDYVQSLNINVAKRFLEEMESRGDDMIRFSPIHIRDIEAFLVPGINRSHFAYLLYSDYNIHPFRRKASMTLATESQGKSQRYLFLYQPTIRGSKVDYIVKLSRESFLQLLAEVLYNKIPYSRNLSVMENVNWWAEIHRITKGLSLYGR